MPTKDSAPIEFGARYRDRHTNFIGVADAITVYQHKCPRVRLTALVNHVPVEHWFDEPTLELVNDDGIGFGAGERQ